MCRLQLPGNGITSRTIWLAQRKSNSFTARRLPAQSRSHPLRALTGLCDIWTKQQSTRHEGVAIKLRLAGIDRANGGAPTVRPGKDGFNSGRTEKRRTRKHTWWAAQPTWPGARFDAPYSTNVQSTRGEARGKPRTHLLRRVPTYQSNDATVWHTLAPAIERSYLPGIIVMERQMVMDSRENKGALGKRARLDSLPYGSSDNRPKPTT